MINESATFEKMKGRAEQLAEKYRDQIDLLDKSVLARVKGGIDHFDAYALGMQLESFSQMHKMLEEQGNVNLLGAIPSIAFDVITAVHGASVIPIIASVQPIEEERGSVYFRRVRAATTRGSQTAGDVLTDPRTSPVVPSGFSGNSIVNEVGATSVAATFTYGFTLAAFPVKSETLVIQLGAGAIMAKDIGAASATPGTGRLWGNGVSGTVVYATGVVSITFAADPGTGSSIFASYQQNFELASDIPQIDSFFDSQSIHARVYALKVTMGLLQSYTMNKRFGMVAAEEAAKDLVLEINKEIGGDIVRKLKAAAPNAGSPVVFSRTAPSGVSYFEHKQTYKDSLAEAEKVLVDQSGRGQVSLLIVGKKHAQTLSTLPGFVKMYDGAMQGLHVLGTLDGVPVIRVTDTAVLGTEEGMALYKGMTPFEAAAVYSPFMPLVTTDVLPQSPNPLNSMRAAAVIAGVDTLVPQYIVKFNTAA